ncbi:MAG: DUF1365 domain-containing protein [Sinobacteraceae bacterium]|nr:DUF1365 domain-containing protein [Nevskiaceae bacterium]
MSAHRVFFGLVTHARFAPVMHRFRYRVSMLGLDLDTLGDAFKGRWLWSVNRLNLACFLRRDHLRGGHSDLATAVRDCVEGRTGQRPQGAVWLLAQPRYFGICFNPISLYLCHGADGRLQTLVAEVHNTPWGEQHLYVLPVPDPQARDIAIAFDKTFHVSPFLPMDLQYRLALRRPHGRLQLALDAWQRGQRIFAARLALTEYPLNGRSLARVLLFTPFMTARVLAAIYWQALRLWRKRAPFFPHPKPAN